MFENGFCLPRTRFTIIINDTGISIYTDSEYHATHLWQQILFLRQNRCLIHSGGVGLSGRGIIFSSFACGGKILLFTRFRNLEGFCFFSDEIIILDPGGTMYSCPFDLAFYPVHLNQFPELSKPEILRYFFNRKRIARELDTIERIPVPSVLKKIKKFGLFVLNQELDQPLPIPLTEVIPMERIGTRMKAEVAIILTRYNAHEIHFKELGQDIFIDKIIRIMVLEYRLNLIYLELLSDYGIISPASYEQQLRRILAESLSGVKTFEVFVPFLMDPVQFSDFLLRFLDTRGK